MQQCFFSIPSMHSIESAARVSNIIESVSGVKNVNADYENSEVRVFLKNEAMTIERIQGKIKDHGYNINLI